MSFYAPILKWWSLRSVGSVFNGIKSTIRSRMSMTNKIVNVAIALFVVAFIVPIAVIQFINVNTTGWDTDLLAVWDTLPIIAVVGIFLVILYFAISKRR